MQIGADLAADLKGGEVIELFGDLGSGKTTLVRGFARALGYKGPVRSPTFTIMNIYPVAHKTIKEIIHLDLYRLGKESEMTALGLEEWLDRKDAVVLIEWPDLAGAFLRAADIRVTMEFINATERKIDIT